MAILRKNERFLINALAVWLAAGTTPVYGEDAIYGSGVVEGASRTVALAFSRNGVIRRVDVGLGDRVENGQVLANLDCPAEDMEAQVALAAVREAEALASKINEPALPTDVRLAEAKVHLAQSERRKREQALDRLLKLNRTTTFASAASIEDSQRDLEMARANEKVAEFALSRVKIGATPAEREAAKARVAHAQSQLGLARAKASQCILRAPQLGTIVGWEAYPGMKVTDAQLKPVGHLSNLSEFRVRAEFDEEAAGQIVVGLSAIISVPERKAAATGGRVEEVRPLITTRSLLSHDSLARTGRGVQEAVVRLNGCAQGICVLGRRVLVKVVLPSRQ